jgi:hypothetical protein
LTWGFCCHFYGDVKVRYWLDIRLWILVFSRANDKKQSFFSLSV